MKNVVIIGGMAAGCKTAARLKRLEPDCMVTIVEKREYVSFGSCGMPLFAAGEVEGFYDLAKTPYGVVRTPEFFRAVKDVEVLVSCAAESIDTENKFVSCRNLADNSAFELKYDYLVIATGAESKVPEVLQIPSSERISTFHHPNDALRFRDMARKGAVGSCTIIGGGLIGCELAEAMVSLWGIETTVIEREDRLLPGCLDKEMALLLENTMKKNDIRLCTGTQASSVTLSDSGNPVVTLDDGNILESDYLFLCPGVRPSVSLAAEAGIAIGEKGGIITDEHLMTNIPGIYAGGDCIETKHYVTGHRSVFPMGSLANRQGRVIAENIAGMDSRFEGSAGTASMTVFGSIAANSGISESAASALGIDYSCVWGTWSDRPDYHPGKKLIYAKMIYEKRNRRLLGIQLFGAGEVTRYADTFSFMLSKSCTVDCLLDFEHAYNPPHSGPVNALNYLGAMAVAAEEQGVQCLNPAHEAGESAILLDVRENTEAKARPLTEKSIHIPLGSLRDELIQLEKNREYILICQKGSRSYEAAVILKAAGFGNVSYLGGGLSLKNGITDDN